MYMFGQCNHYYMQVLQFRQHCLPYSIVTVFSQWNILRTQLKQNFFRNGLFAYGLMFTNRYFPNILYRVVIIIFVKYDTKFCSDT